MMRNINYLIIVSALNFFIGINCYAGDQLIDQMISTYKANQARFHSQYRETAIQGQGVVSEINADSFGTGRAFYVHMIVNGSKVQCSTDNKDSAAALDKGISVKFSGNVYDVVFDRLSVRECQFEKISALGNFRDDRNENLFKEIKKGQTLDQAVAILDKGKNFQLYAIYEKNGQLIFCDSGAGYVNALIIYPTDKSLLSKIKKIPTIFELGNHLKKEVWKDTPDNIRVYIDDKRDPRTQRGLIEFLIIETDANKKIVRTVNNTN